MAGLRQFGNQAGSSSKLSTNSVNSQQKNPYRSSVTTCFIVAQLECSQNKRCKSLWILHALIGVDPIMAKPMICPWFVSDRFRIGQSISARTKSLLSRTPRHSCATCKTRWRNNYVYKPLISLNCGSTCVERVLNQRETELEQDLDLKTTTTERRLLWLS